MKIVELKYVVACLYNIIHTGFLQITWTGRCEHRQGLVVLLFPLETLNKLSLAFQEAEASTKACIKHIVDPCNSNNLQESLCLSKSSCVLVISCFIVTYKHSIKLKNIICTYQDL